MQTSRFHTIRPLSLRALVLGALVASLLLLVTPQRAFAATSSDDFTRANGSLGADWTDMSVGGLAISNDVVIGTQASANSGDIYTGQTFGSDQFSQIELTATQLSGGQWIGPAVRAQDGGQDLYVGIYWWNNGNPELMLFKLVNGNWTQLGSAHPSGPLAAGTQLNLTVTGSTLSFSENGVVEVTATDTSLTGGAPAIMAYGTPTAGNWVGGDGTSSVAGTYSIGGTISGLSGTVVLENNGGDDLSISANGTFTFSSLLDQSAPYAVTVSSDPSGQACTVADGSGTVSADVTNVAVTCGTQAGGSVSDDFTRANGSLGADWTDMSVGGLAISNDVVIGTQASANSGDIYTGQTFGSDQFSQIELTATQLSGGQWIGPAVRAQNGGQGLYVGIYWWNNGNPELMLFKLVNGNWTQLGSAHPSGPLAAGTQLNLTVTGSTLSFSENGVVEVTATDTSLTGGAPAIMAYGTPTAGNWVGGDGTSSVAGTYSIGGTISGLSGTVVLENNGGDDLSISANGTFTFSSLLDQSAPYAVTVSSDPSGQACTVADGSGTVSADVTNVAVTCGTQAGGSVSDDFTRANGSLGADWTDMSVGGLAISNDAVIGTQASANSGDIYTGQTFGSDQFSQIELTATQLSGGQWIGPAVRAQDGGQDLYVGIYWWNNGNPELMLFKLVNGNWTQLGSAHPSGPLAAGTQLNLTVTGSTLSFSENGVVEVTATDTSLTGGAPAIMAYGTPTAGNWVGGDGTSSVAGTYSIGGTISGLSGTVVLENNGGDDLSISANGTFTFSSLLDQSAPYAVTVSSDPSGQACTVADGSGTVSADVTNVAVTCGTQAGGSVSDDFTRANGSLGADWTDMSVGGLAISNDVVIGTQASANSGDIYTGQTFGSDQFSQIELTATQLSGGQWIGPAVRAQDGGQDLYVGIYWWNNGNPELMLFKLVNGNWTQLGLRPPIGAPRRRHPVEPDRDRLHTLVLRERCRGSNGHRHQLDRRCPGHHGLRHSDRRQLGRRRRHLFGRRHLFDRRHHLGAFGDGRPREQRRGRSEHQCQRHLHLQLPVGPERPLRRHRVERSLRSGLHRRRRIRHRVGRRHQRRRHLWHRRIFGSIREHGRQQHSVLFLHVRQRRGRSSDTSCAASDSPGSRGHAQFPLRASRRGGTGHHLR